jgi:hypothetical protein
MIGCWEPKIVLASNCLLRICISIIPKKNSYISIACMGREPTWLHLSIEL